MSRSGSRSFDLQVSDEGGTADYRLSLTDGDVTVAEVLDALGMGDDAMIDGQVVTAPAMSRAVEVLSSGSQLATTRGFIAAPPSSRQPLATVEVVVVAGYDAGHLTQLGSGLFHVCMNSRDPKAGWYLEIQNPELAPIEARPWHLHGPSIETAPDHGLVVGLGKPVEIEAGYTRTVYRPPRVLPPDEVDPIEIVNPPAPVQPPAPLSWATLLAPIPIALMMAFFFRPLFALFAVMGPVMALGRWYESRRRFRKESSEREAKVESMLAAVETAADEQADAIAQLRWLTHPHIGELWRRARVKSVRLWERRPAAPGFMVVSVGIGRDHVPASTHGNKPTEEIHEILRNPLEVRPVPHTVDLATNTGIGIHGERQEALAVARSVVMQLATLHGPADLKIGVLGDRRAAEEWDWVKWLPHAEAALTAHSAHPIAQKLAANEQRKSLTMSNHTKTEVGQVRLVIVDDASADVAAICRAAKTAGHDLRVVAVASQPTMLPAACSSLVRVDGVAAEIASPELTGRRSEVCPIGVTQRTAASWARSLAAMDDPEVDEFTPGEDRVSLLRLVGYESVEELADRWSRRPVDVSPEVAVGVGDEGDFRVNLTEDGPHVLIAGTTGSGKSELLRTLVVGLAVECPPEQLNFVLIDFKGGGAFDAVDRLPHVAGLITDLDEAMVVRALNSLRAELQRREVLFREVGVSNYEDAVRQSDEPLERLLIVIDEFAVLATDYAELMNAVIDLAGRGRSLGMHLVLATQRPSGVVDQKIRANTNLRVALRVQDAFDSQDVIGIADAAQIDRKSPGRAIFSVGGDSPVTVQTAYSGAVDARSTRCSVEPHLLFANARPTARALVLADAQQPEARTELDVLVEAITTVSAARNYCARPLWSEPLPTILDWIDLGARELVTDPNSAKSVTGGIALGLVDLPERQTQVPWRWDPDSGPLAVYGGSADCAGKMLVSVGAALASSGEPDSLHLYAIDGGRGAITCLADLVHTGGYITMAETDRIERAIRFFETNLAERRSRRDTDGAPRLVLLIDNLAAVLSMYDEVTAAALVDRLSGIARDGSAQRLHLVLTARTVRDIGHRLSQQMVNRLVLALADPGGYLTLGIKARDLVDLPEMRAIDLVSGHVLQLVEPPELSGWPNQQQPDADRRAQPIRACPDSVGRSELPPASLDAGALHIPVGIEAEHLGVARLVLQIEEHALIVASNGMGRSTLVETILRQLGESGIELDLVRIGPARSPITEPTMPGRLLSSAEQIEEIASRESTSTLRDTVVVIDDAHSLPTDQAAALERLIDKTEGAPRIIAATTPNAARSMRMWTARIRDAGTGVLIGATPSELDLFNASPGRADAVGSRPGRGYLVVRGRVSQVQFAHPNAAA